MCACNVNHGITIISTKGAIKGFTNGFVSHSVVNAYIFCVILIESVLQKWKMKFYATDPQRRFEKEKLHPNT